MSKARHERKRRELILRDERRSRGKTKRGAIHTVVNPAGSKLLKGFYRAKHGTKPKSAAEALSWYAALS